MTKHTSKHGTYYYNRLELYPSPTVLHSLWVTGYLQIHRKMPGIIFQNTNAAISYK